MESGKSFLALLKRLCIHLFLWVLVLLFFSFFLGLEAGSFSEKIGFSAFLLPVTILTTYVVIYHLIPRYLLPKKYFRFALYSFYTLVVSAVFIIISAFYAFVIALKLEWNESLPISKSIFYIMITIYLVVVIASAFSLLKNNYTSAAKNEELKNRILEAQLKLKEQELHYLKMQIHPHFLFNTLNTIYGLSLSNNAKTPEMILQLSELLDYILYQTRKPVVKLKDEVNHIRNYIDLEQKRFQDALSINLDIDPIPEQLEISPMLLLPLVENSFKHGKDAQGSLRIKLHLKITGSNLNFEIINSKAEKNPVSESQGIGLKNIRRRLEILYPHHFELKIHNLTEEFRAFLYVNLHQNPQKIE